MRTYRDPASDNNESNPLDSAPPTATVMSRQDSRLIDPANESTPDSFDRIRNPRTR